MNTYSLGLMCIVHWGLKTGHKVIINYFHFLAGPIMKCGIINGFLTQNISILIQGKQLTMIQCSLVFTTFCSNYKSNPLLLVEVFNHFAALLLNLKL